MELPYKGLFFQYEKEGYRGGRSWHCKCGSLNSVTWKLSRNSLSQDRTYPYPLN